MRTNDFNSSLISYKEIENNLSRIFSDSIIIDTNFRILDISENVLSLLSYEKSQVVSHPIDFVISNGIDDIISMLAHSLYVQTECKLKDRSQKEIDVVLSAYYLGLISDINGKIIIQIKDRKDFLAMKEKLEEKVSEFNTFIYRTSHDLKGPIATIKGLALISQMEVNPDEVRRYLDMIYKVADKLDQILGSLKETLNEDDLYIYETDLAGLVREILSRINKFKELNDWSFETIVDMSPEAGKFCTNPSLVFSLVENLLRVLNFSKQFYNWPYTIKIYAAANEIIIDIVYAGDAIIYLAQLFNERLAANPASTGEVGNTYNYMSINILKKCLKMTNSSLKFYNEEKNALIKIVVPSLNNSSSIK